jgi:hypothetical protein
VCQSVVSSSVSLPPRREIVRPSASSPYRTEQPCSGFGTLSQLLCYPVVLALRRMFPSDGVGLHAWPSCRRQPDYDGVRALAGRRRASPEAKRCCVLCPSEAASRLKVDGRTGRKETRTDGQPLWSRSTEKFDTTRVSRRNEFALAQGASGACVITVQNRGTGNA